ncbi:MAG: hypothetical protein CL666_05810 [Balneola sp.]|nr:hypothetical protein [Balneola sp.]|tara:strand:+ start:163071 stop:163340 length:270 start_codon:yes stop_codon:yes gene_type:complete
MRKLTPSERSILDRLIFPESFDVIQEETELAYGELRDDIINLMNSRLIEVVESEQSPKNSIQWFDSDNIKESTYRITKSGIKHMKQVKR